MLRAWLDALDEDEEGPEEANAETEQAADPSEPTIPPILDAAKETAAAADDDDPAALGPKRCPGAAPPPLPPSTE